MRSFARMLIIRPGVKFLAIEQKVGPVCIWNLPGGKVDAGETPLAAAVREVFEEVGFKCNPRFVRHLCRRQMALEQSTWIGHFFIYFGPLFSMEVREPEKIVSLRWLESNEARILDAHHNVFTDIFDFALTKFTVDHDPWTEKKCVVRSNTLKRLDRDEGLISALSAR